MKKVGAITAAIGFLLALGLFFVRRSAWYARQMEKTIPARLLSGGTVRDVTLSLEGLGEEERDILLAGCLMNWYKQGKGTKA